MATIIHYGNGTQVRFEVPGSLTKVVYVNGVLTTPLSVAFESVTLSVAPALGKPVQINYEVSAVFVSPGNAVGAFTDLTDKTSVDLPGINGPLAAALAPVPEDVTGTTYTFLAADKGKTKRFTNAAPCAATVLGALGPGWYCSVMQGAGAGAVTIVQGAGAAVTSLDGTLTTSGPKATVAIIPQALDSYLVVGALTNSVAVKDAVQVFTKNQSFLPVALVDAVTIVTDASLSNTFKLTMVTNGRAMGTPSNPTDGMPCNWIVNSGAGGFAMTWAPAFDFGAQGAPVHSTAANKEDLVSGVYSAGTGKWLSNHRKGS